MYLHGFISSPASHKAVMLGDYVANHAGDLDYRVPALTDRPARALEQAIAACAGVARDALTVVGSSLGGFYATVIAQSLGCRAVLLNPAVHPWRHFDRFRGPHRNLYTGEEFVLGDAHVEELRAMDVAAITEPQRYWLFVETGDDVLDYREAVAFYAGALQDVTTGGDHTLTTFPECIPDIVAWARSAVPPPGSNETTGAVKRQAP